jgi:hypothetical protein
MNKIHLKDKDLTTRKICLFLSFIYILGAFCFCKKEQNKEPFDSIVTRMDIQKMRELYLSDFQLVRETVRPDYLGTEYVFQRESDSVGFYMTVGIAESDKVAQVSLSNLLKEVSMVMTSGPHLGISVGDEYWWLAKYDDESILINIAFVRKNVLITMGGGNHYDKLESLAKNIDNDILKKASYIDFVNFSDQ